MRRRELFAPLMASTTHISPCFEYRDRAEGESEADYGRRVADELETEILRLGPDSVMAFVAEAVVGATLGAVPPVTGYFKRVREICAQHGVLLILDEVMCGVGRCGTKFSCVQDAIAPDMITVAMGLGAWYQPVGAMLCGAAVYDAVAHGSEFFQHGHTYLGHPVAAAAALAALKRLDDDGVDDQIDELVTKLSTALDSVLGRSL